MRVVSEFCNETVHPICHFLILFSFDHIRECLHKHLVVTGNWQFFLSSDHLTFNTKKTSAVKMLRRCNSSHFCKRIHCRASKAESTPLQAKQDWDWNFSLHGIKSREHYSAGKTRLGFELLAGLGYFLRLSSW